MENKRIVLPGGAGLVGQNLVARLKARGYSNIVMTLSIVFGNITKNQYLVKYLILAEQDFLTVQY